MSYHEHIIDKENVPPVALGQKRKRTSQELTVQEDIAWTAARCNRLLRTISSRIGTLRRLLRTEASQDQPREAPKQPAEHWSLADPAWLPNGNQKAQSRTYAAKAKAAKTKVSRPKPDTGGLAFPSPFIRRITTRDAHSVKDTAESSGKGSMVPAPMCRRRHLPIKPSSSVQEAEQGLGGALTNLLATSRTRESKEMIGARSLMGTCLRKVPQYMEINEESCSELDGDVSSEMTSEVFSYLEGFGTKEGRGWVGLQEVVRSHGVRLVCNAIEDDVLQEHAVEAFVDICSSQGAVAEGRLMLQAWLSGPSGLRPRRIEKFHHFCKFHECEAFRFRTMRMLGQQDVTAFPKTCDTPGFGHLLLNSLTGPASHAATEYLSSYTNACGAVDNFPQPRKRISAEMKDMMLKLATMATAGVLLGEAHATSPLLREAIHRITVDTIMTCGQSTRLLDDIGMMFLMSSQLLLELQLESNSGFRVLDSTRLAGLFGNGSVGHKACAGRSSLEDREHDFTYDVAESIVALEKFLDLDLTGRLVDRILNSTTFLGPLLRQVAMEIITIVKQSGKTFDETAFEQCLRKVATTSDRLSTAPHTPHPKKATSRLRWEEGLCEWVTATPFTVMTKSIGPGKDTSIAGDDAEATNAAHEHLAHLPTILNCSPDVLTMTPPAKRVKRKTESPLKLSYQSSRKMLVPLIHRQRPRRRTSTRLSAEEAAGDDSSDELGF